MFSAFPLPPPLSTDERRAAFRGVERLALRVDLDVRIVLEHPARQMTADGLEDVVRHAHLGQFGDQRVAQVMKPQPWQARGTSGWSRQSGPTDMPARGNAQARCVNLPQPKLRVLSSSPNDAATQLGIRFHENMQVPETSLVSQAFNGSNDRVEGQEPLEIWQTSSGGPIGHGRLHIEGRRRGDDMWCLVHVDSAATGAGMIPARNRWRQDGADRQPDPFLNPSGADTRGRQPQAGLDYQRRHGRKEQWPDASPGWKRFAVRQRRPLSGCIPRRAAEPECRGGGRLCRGRRSTGRTPWPACQLALPQNAVVQFLLCQRDAHILPYPVAGSKSSTSRSIERRLSSTAHSREISAKSSLSTSWRGGSLNHSRFQRATRSR